MTGTTSQKQGSTTNEPWAPARAPLKSLYGDAESAYQMGKGQYYTGDFLSGYNPMQQAGAKGLANASLSMGTGAEELRNLGVSTASGDFLNPGSNPYLAGAIDSGNRTVMRNLNESILPQINDMAISSGAYGGSRQDLSQERAVGNATREMADSTNNMLLTNYENERQRQIQAPDLFTAANELAATPGMTQMGLGDYWQQQADRGLQNKMQKFDAWNNGQWNGMDKLAALLTSGGFGESTTYKEVNPFAQILQMVTGGLGMFKGLMGGGGGGGGMFGGMAAA